MGFFTIRCCIRIKQIAQRSLFTVAADRIVGYRQTAVLQKLCRKCSGRVHTGVFVFRMIQIGDVHKFAIRISPRTIFRNYWFCRILKCTTCLIQVNIRIIVLQCGFHDALHVHVVLAPRTAGARSQIPKTGFTHGGAAEEQQCILIDAVAVILKFRASRQDVVPVTADLRVIVKQVDGGACRCDALYRMICQIIISRSGLTGARICSSI